MLLKNSKILCIFAHPDDEIIFGWPIMQNPNFNRSLIICAGKQKGRNALHEVCIKENINLVDTLKLPNTFYALPFRRAEIKLKDVLKIINDAITKELCINKYDFIFTHNPVGEYGHGDHRLIFELITQHPLTQNVLVTNIIEQDAGKCHRNDGKIPDYIKKIYYDPAEKLCEVELDRSFYLRNQNIYEQNQAWTWHRKLSSSYPIAHTNLYKIKKCGETISQPISF